MPSEWHSRKYRYRYWRPYTGFPSGNPHEDTTHWQSFSDDLIHSQSNPVSLLGKTEQRIGGRFLVVKRAYDESSTLGEGEHYFSTTSNPMVTGSGGNGYATPIFARAFGFGNSMFPTVTPTSADAMNALGSLAISRVAPNRSEADLSTFIGELREGLPHAIGLGRTGRNRARRSLNAGDEYLNVEFGWKPLISDVQRMATAVRNAESILEQFRRDSGRLVRRRYDFPTDLSTSITYGTGQPRPTLYTNAFQSGAYQGPLVTTTRSETKRWFSGAFRYYIPDSPIGSRLSEANKLLGTNLDPAMLWNLAPWSWAVDWFGNMGVLAENLSLLSSDSLVMPFGYMMETKSVSVEYQLSGIRFRSYPGTHVFRQKFTTTVKQRVVATPYGFEMKWENLSPRQLAILAALGISKGR